MWKFLDAVRPQLGRQPFMKPIYDLGLLKQTIVAALIVLFAVTVGGAPVAIVIVFFMGLASRVSIRPAGGSSH
jgi:hypothetical protein